MMENNQRASLLLSLNPVLRTEDYVYATWPEGRPLEEGLEAVIREPEGTTAVLTRKRADYLGLEYSLVVSWISLEVRAGLDAAGATAAVSTALTAAHISCRFLAGISGNHVLVPVGDAARALETLREMRAAHRGQEAASAVFSLRGESPADRPAILELIEQAFSVSPVGSQSAAETPVEVGLLRRLFDAEEYLPEFSIVAESHGEIVGYVISTRAWVDGLPLLGLGPLGVVPRLQQHGIGSALMAETIRRANGAGERGIALLGSPEYYGKFGFVSADSFGIGAPVEAWGRSFQFLPLALWPGGVQGTFEYARHFLQL